MNQAPILCHLGNTIRDSTRKCGKVCHFILNWITLLLKTMKGFVYQEKRWKFSDRSSLDGVENFMNRLVTRKVAWFVNYSCSCKLVFYSILWFQKITILREPQQNFVSSWKYYPNFFEGMRSALPMYKEGPLAGKYRKNSRGIRLNLFIETNPVTFLSCPNLAPRVRNSVV